MASQKYVPIEDRFKEVDDAARAIGKDKASVNSLFDAVYRVFSTFRGSGAIVRFFERAVIQSELDYRRGKQDSVSEQTLVRTFNALVQELSAPETARTSMEEVRLVRINASRRMPHFVFQRTVQGLEERQGIVFTIEASMSPLETVYVTDQLIGQRIVNEIIRLNKIKYPVEATSSIGPGKSPVESRLVGYSVPEGGETHRILERFKKMTRRNQLALFKSSFNSLGLKFKLTTEFLLECKFFFNR